MGHKKAPSIDEAFAVWTGLEPATSCVTGRHSNQLNYQTFRLRCCKSRCTLYYFQYTYAINFNDVMCVV